MMKKPCRSSKTAKLHTSERLYDDRSRIFGIGRKLFYAAFYMLFIKSLTYLPSFAKM